MRFGICCGPGSFVPQSGDKNESSIGRMMEVLQDAARSIGCSLHDAVSAVPGKAGVNLGAFVAMVDVLREQTQGMSLRDAIARLRPLFDQFATPYRARAERIIAEDDDVVVLARGEVMTKAGKPYNNSYCFVIRMAGR